MICCVCPRNCKVDRTIKCAFCGQKKLKIQKAMVHNFEEPLISGNKGSGAIFFSGCNLKCLFCQNYQLSHQNVGTEISVFDLISIIKKLESKGVHNINFVSPTHFVDQIIEALKIYKPKIPIVWNTGGYEKPQTIEKLKNYVDIFLFDIKYYSPKLSKEYSQAEDYFDFAMKSLIVARQIVPNDVVEDGIMKKGIIVRHLVLPKASSDSVKILDEINKNLGNETFVSLLNQYTPCFKAKQHKILKNKVTDLEYKRVVCHAIDLGFENAFVQEKSSQTEEFIPNFDQKFDVQQFLQSDLI
ncbi:MAG: radical SAM protein [Christensenellales bacterium]